MKVCEFLRSNILTAPQGEPCPGCCQCGVCICLAPMAAESPRGSSKKRSQSQKSSLLRKETTPTTTTTATMPTQQNTPHGTERTDSSVPSSVTREGREPEASSTSLSLSSSTLSPAYPPEAYNLLIRLLDPSPDTRITATEALAHPFLNPWHWER